MFKIEQHLFFSTKIAFTRTKKIHSKILFLQQTTIPKREGR